MKDDTVPEREFNSELDVHEYNMDAAQRDLDRRAIWGEDMSRAWIDKKTYEIRKDEQSDVDMEAWGMDNRYNCDHPSFHLKGESK
jgi:hypothetical protein